MFSLTPESIRYIKKNGGNVLVSMSFEPSLGGC
jgi:hypothetical protein